MRVPKEHPSDRHVRGDARPEGVTSVAAASLAETMQEHEGGLPSAAASSGEDEGSEGDPPGHI